MCVFGGPAFDLCTCRTDSVLHDFNRERDDLGLPIIVHGLCEKFFVPILFRDLTGDLDYEFGFGRGKHEVKIFALVLHCLHMGEISAAKVTARLSVS